MPSPEARRRLPPSRRMLQTGRMKKETGMQLRATWTAGPAAWPLRTDRCPCSRGTCHYHWVCTWARASLSFPSLPVRWLRLMHSPVRPEGWSVSLKSPLAKGGLVPQRGHSSVVASPWPEGGSQKLSVQKEVLWQLFFRTAEQEALGGQARSRKDIHQTTERVWNVRTDS